MNYKISICIPTYNRAERLESLLAELCPMVVTCSQPGTVQVCVSDNGSNDHTAEVLRIYLKKYPFTKAHRNPQNLGFGRNLWAVAHMAEGEYIYFTGDDDSFNPNGLEVLLQACTKQDAGLILFGTHPTHRSLARGFSQGQSVPIESLENYIENLGIFYASFIGNLCFKRSAFLENCDIGEAVELSAYPHMFPVLRVIRSRGALLINTPITVFDDTERGWRKMQPVYTSVDMARIAREEVLTHIPKRNRSALLVKFARSLPWAIFKCLSRQINVDTKNPYQCLYPLNLLSIYLLKNRLTK
ncbi:glycosyltransferase family 2 protein [Desulfobulbus propionicus]